MFIRIVYNYLFYASYHIINKPDFRHILRLQMGKLFGQIIGIHITVAWNEQAAAVCFHQFQIS